jgi:hypothetical protein
VVWNVDHSISFHCSALAGGLLNLKAQHVGQFFTVIRANNKVRPILGCLVMAINTLLRKREIAVFK